MLLIVSQKNDFHVDFFLERLSSENRDGILRFNTEEFPTQVKLNLTDSKSIKINGLTYDLKDVTSVWYRRPAQPIISSGVSLPEARKYAQEECEAMLSSLWSLMDWPLWVNHPALIKTAGHKMQQLAAASKIGFACPKTLVTNDEQEARKFLISLGGHGIIKSVSKCNFQSDDGKWKIIYTTPISAEDIRLRDVEIGPVVFQEYVPKKIELRVTVVGTQVFACAIESQVSERTRNDWRRYDMANTPHYQFSIPTAVEKRCLALVQGYKLNYGAIDLILTPSGEYVFLELNPNGQWAWIEELTRLPIAAALESLLFSREL